MSYSREDLEDELSRLLFDSEKKDMLKDARQLLGKNSLNEAKMFNWRRRGLVRSLVEGAALIHVSRENFDTRAARRIGLIADAFFQIFIVGQEKKSKEAKDDYRDMWSLRYWSGVCPYKHRERTDEQLYLTHKASFLVPKNTNLESLEIKDLITDQPIPKDNPKDNPKDSSWLLDKISSELSDMYDISFAWRIREDQSHYGYIMKYSNVVSGKVQAGRPPFEYLWGGAGGLPTELGVLLLFLPNDMLRQVENRSPFSRGNRMASDFEKPQCIGLHIEGDPFASIDGILKGERQTKYLANWLELNPKDVQVVTSDVEFLRRKIEIEVPDKLSNKFTDLIKKTYQGAEHTGFLANLIRPEPLLRYLFTIPLPNLRAEE